MAKEQQPAPASAPAREKEGEAPAQQPEPGKVGEVKKGVLDEHDLRQGNKLFAVRIDKFRGECRGVRFNDECIATNVSEEQLADLREHFGEQVQALDQEAAAAAVQA